MGDKFLGQHLSERWFDKGPDPARKRVWLALRYLSIVIGVVLVPIFVGRSPGGAFLLGIGAGVGLSGLINLILVPRREQRRSVATIALGAGIVLASAGGLFLAAA